MFYYVPRTALYLLHQFEALSKVAQNSFTQPSKFFHSPHKALSQPIKALTYNTHRSNERLRMTFKGIHLFNADELVG